MITIQVFCLTCTSEATPPRSVFLRRLPVSVFVPNDSLAVTSCACADPDGEESPCGEGGGGGGDVGAIRGRILASLSYLQQLSATPYPQSSVLPRCSRERQVLKWRLLSSLQRTDVQTNLKLLAVGSHVHTKRRTNWTDSRNTTAALFCITAPINIDHETPPTQTIFSLDCSKAARSTALKTRP